MRKCIVVPRHWVQPTPGTSSIPTGKYVNQSSVTATFHRFAEEDCDGSRSVMAVVEYADGTLDTVPLTWVTLFPEEVIEGIALTAEPIKFISDEFESRIMHILEVGLHQFTMMCQNIGNRR